MFPLRCSAVVNVWMEHCDRVESGQFQLGFSLGAIPSVQFDVTHMSCRSRHGEPWLRLLVGRCNEAICIVLTPCFLALVGPIS